MRTRLDWLHMSQQIFPPKSLPAFFEQRTLGTVSTLLHLTRETDLLHAFITRVPSKRSR